MNFSTEDRPDEDEYAYGYLIEVLTGGLYHNKFHVIREYIQNGFDAINAYKKEFPDTVEDLTIQVKLMPPSILIVDNGIGMGRNKINQYRKIGYSEKKIGEGVGFRGIGKLSGLSIAHKLIVTSKQKGADECHKIVFDAHSMLQEIIALKDAGKNMSLNNLVKNHTVVSSEPDEDTDKHYTIVELFNIKEDSKILFDQQLMADYISLNCPVGFNPSFQYAEVIEDEIKMHIADYSTVPVKLNGRAIYKPYISDCKHPGFIPVWSDEQDMPVAFCWYCENKSKGQFEDKEISGLLYKFKNFTVGDRHLTRTSMWNTTPERAFYFFGEVYVNLKGVMPSSERSNFEHNEARNVLYHKCLNISRELNAKAGRSSNQHSAATKLEQATQKINEIHKGLETQKIPVELQFDKTVETLTIVKDLEKRINYLPDSSRSIARDVIDKGRGIVNTLNNDTLQKRLKESDKRSNIDNGRMHPLYDIKREVGLDIQASIVYDTIINVIKEYYRDDLHTLEYILKKIHKSLKETVNIKEG